MLANGTDKLKNRNALLTDALAALHPIKLATQQAPTVRISLGVFPVQRLHACVNAPTC
jgi:hypothetical protein